MAENEVDGCSHHVNARRVLVIREAVIEWERLHLVTWIFLPHSARGNPTHGNGFKASCLSDKQGYQ
jgi:hypothetical protein